MGVKVGKKRKLSVQNVESDEEEKVVLPPPSRSSDEPVPKRVKWINKQRVLVFGMRGLSYRDRHLMMDMRNLMPHSRSENKFERKENLFAINEVCEMKNCNKVVLFEGRLKRDLYMWLASVPSGPSAKFLVENVYTMAELKLTGNCLKSSRPLLSFDKTFDSEPHYQLMKEILIQIFGTPNAHPKSQPFIDHILTFSIFDNRIWFRNYQILSEDGALAEIGPRFALNPIKIFDSSFGGATLWENPHYVSPGQHRKLLNKTTAAKYLNRLTQKTHYEMDRPETSYALNDGDDIFVGDAYKKAENIVQKEEAAEVAERKSEVAGENGKPEKKKGKKKSKSSKSVLQDQGLPSSGGVAVSPRVKKLKKKSKVPNSADKDAQPSGPKGPSPGKVKASKIAPIKVKKIKNKRIANMKLKLAKSKAKEQ